ncbi:MAG: hypothetical protein QXL10_00970 [Candidatus Bathyarchaeia archaeon]
MPRDLDGIFKRVAKLPRELQLILLEDWITALENRLKVMEAACA